MNERTVNGYTLIAHHDLGEGFLIMGSQVLKTGDYEYVVATMNDLSEPHWFSGYYTHNIVNAINTYYEKVR